jgi:hypothetical protein
VKHSKFANAPAVSRGPRRAVAALLASTLLIAPVMAQLGAVKPVVEPTTETQTVFENDLKASMANMAPSALRAVDQNRFSIIETIVNQWRGELTGTDAKAQDALVSELRSSLSALRADNLLAASTARTLDGLKVIFAFSDEQAKTLAAVSKGERQKVLGSLTSDLVYTPMAPCKLVDTRSPGTGYIYPAGGAFALSEKRTYNSFSCPFTPSNAAALQVSAVTQYTGAGGGILSLMANGAAPPLTNVFYGGYSPVTTVVPVNGASPGGLFDAQISGVAGADLIIEAVGYYAAPQATALTCTIVAGPTVSSPINGYTYLGLTTCPTGYTAVSGGFDAPGNVVMADNRQFNSAGGNGNAWNMYVKNLSGAAQNVTPQISCCRIPGR